MSRLEALLAEVRERHPKYRIVEKTKSGWFWRIIWRLISLFNKRFMQGYATTIGSTTHVGSEFALWDDLDQWHQIRHEAVHVDQAHSWPFGARVGRLNIPFFSFFYLLVLPFFYTFRAKFEKEAYAESIIVSVQLGELDDPEVVARAVSRYVEIFSGPDYLWMARRAAVKAWAEATIEKVKKGEIVSRWRN